LPARAAVLAVLAALLSAPAFAAEGSARLMFTGDILLSRQVAEQIKSAGAFPWQDMAPVFKNADFLMGNFEGAVGSAADCDPDDAKQHLCFAVDPSTAALMAKAGFTAASVENNHSQDLNVHGKLETISVLEKSGVAAVNFRQSPYFFNVNGIILGVVAFDDTGDPVSPVILRRKLRLARNMSNLTVVFVHWGVELNNWISQKQQDRAQWLVANGADLVIGSHPHVPQPAQCMDGKPVYYSLGNHLFDQMFPETKKGLIADCAISSGTMRCGALRTKSGERSFSPEPDGEDSAAEKALQSCPVSLHATPCIDGYCLRPAAGQKWTSSVHLSMESALDGKSLWQSPEKKIFSAEILAEPDGSRRLFTLEDHFSPLDREHSPRPYVYAVKDNMLGAKWRGSALAWPLIDAKLLGDGADQFLCALHRGDSFLLPDPDTTKARTAIYKWNGFGFEGFEDAAKAAACAGYFDKEARDAGLEIIK
jgi:poly-gamma-glutamate synthesis protein (capsule biosynthesis protein)